MEKAALSSRDSHETPKRKRHAKTPSLSEISMPQSTTKKRSKSRIINVRRFLTTDDGKKVEIPKEEFDKALLSPAIKLDSPRTNQTSKTIRQSEYTRLTPQGKKVRVKVVTKTVTKRSYSSIQESRPGSALEEKKPPILRLKK